MSEAAALAELKRIEQVRLAKLGATISPAEKALIAKASEADVAKHAEEVEAEIVMAKLVSKDKRKRNEGMLPPAIRLEKEASELRMQRRVEENSTRLSEGNPDGFKHLGFPVRRPTV